MALFLEVFCFTGSDRALNCMDYVSISNEMNRAERIFWRGLALFYAAVIFWLSSIPPIQTGPSYADKIFHFTEYFIFAFLLLKAFTKRLVQGKDAIAPLLIGAIYAATDELHQAFVPGRTPSVFDWIADVAGILGMLTLMFISLKWRGKAVKYETV
jgi:VanZ family protein